MKSLYDIDVGSTETVDHILSHFPLSYQNADWPVWKDTSWII